MTISGAVRGRIRIRSIDVRPLKLYRLRAMAIIEPSTVAITVATSATFRLTTSASVSSRSTKGWAQFSSVNLCQTMLKLPDGWLNENSTIRKIGANR